MSSIKLLIIDDSTMVRTLFSQRLSEDPDIQVVGTAADVFEGRDKIIKLRPDVVTLDIEMPRMDGIEFLKKLMPQYPLPTIVVSAVNGRVFDALNAGAVEFVGKPTANTDLNTYFKELIVKIKIASTAKVGYHKRNVTEKVIGAGRYQAMSNRVIAIGASTGGTNALVDVLKLFPRDIPGTVIVQHMPPMFTKLYADRLNNSMNLEIKEAEEGDEVRPGRVLIAPGGYHMRIKKLGAKFVVKLTLGTEDNKVSGHCPSVDVLFDSVADEIKDKAIGVILTGMGKDGADGLLKMRKNGAHTIGQDEETSIVYGMPKVAFDIGAVEKQYPLPKIAAAIMSLLSKDLK